MAIVIVVISIIQAVKPFISYSIRATFQSSSYQPSLNEDNEDNACNDDSMDSQVKKRLIDSTYNSSKKSFITSL